MEIDPCVVTIAEKYFGFPKPNDRLRVVVDDALNYLRETSQKPLGNGFTPVLTTNDVLWNVNFLQTVSNTLLLLKFLKRTYRKKGTKEFLCYSIEKCLHNNRRLTFVIFVVHNPSIADDKVDVLFVDLAGPIQQDGLSCPPSAFVTEDSLSLMKSCLTPEKGMGFSYNVLEVVSFGLLKNISFLELLLCF